MAKSSNSDVFLYLLAIFLPFVSVFLKRGCSADLLINIALDCLGWIPGVIHAWYIIGKYDPARQVRHGGAPGHASGPRY